MLNDKSIAKKTQAILDEYFKGKRSGLFVGHNKPLKSIFKKALGSKVSFKKGRNGGMYISVDLKREDIEKAICKKKIVSVPVVKIDTIGIEKSKKFKESCEYLSKSIESISYLRSEDLQNIINSLETIISKCKDLIPEAVDKEILELEKEIINKKRLKQSCET